MGVVKPEDREARLYTGCFQKKNKNIFHDSSTIACNEVHPSAQYSPLARRTLSDLLPDLNAVNYSIVKKRRFSTDA